MIGAIHVLVKLAEWAATHPDEVKSGIDIAEESVEAGLHLASRFRDAMKHHGVSSHEYIEGADTHFAEKHKS